MHMVQEKGKFSSQPQQNLSGAHEIEETSEISAKNDEVKAIITLRSGKQVDQLCQNQKRIKDGNKRKM